MNARATVQGIQSRIIECDKRIDSRTMCINSRVVCILAVMGMEAKNPEFYDVSQAVHNYVRMHPTRQL
jgi:hypothetical protein